MTMHRRRLWAAALLAAWGLPVVTYGQNVTWWNPDWPYRRELSVAVVPQRDLPGGEVAVATFLTSGLTAADGRDVRIVSRMGDLRPHRILMVGPGDQVTVAFSLRPQEKSYYAYFGNAEPGSPPEPLEIRRGVLMETRQYDAGPIGTLEEVRRAFDRGKPLLGRGFRPSLYQGHNPFGPQDRICSHYRAWFVAPRAGEYLFALSSRDASFLLLDDEVVLENGGRHNPQRTIELNARRTLAPGLHALEVFHVNLGGDPILAVAWQPPGAPRPVPMPADAFPAVPAASVGRLEQYGRQITGDYAAVHAGEAFVGDAYLQRYGFHESVSTQRISNPRYTWDFGDGQTSDRPSVEHVYLTPGEYTVTLTVGSGLGTFARANRIVVSRDWDAVTSREIDEPAAHAQIVAGYDFTKMALRDFAAAAVLLESTGQTARLADLARALATRPAIPGDVARAVLPRSVSYWRESGNAEQGVAALQQAATATDDPAAGAELTVLAGRLLLDDLHRPDEAMALFERAVRTYAPLTTDPVIRDARIGIGDVHRARGDGEAAREAYAQVPPLQVLDHARQAVRRGDLSRHVEEYLRTGDLADAEESLNTWEREFPLDRIEGHSTLLRTRLRLQQRRWADAAAEAEVLARANPASQYAAQLLLLASDAYGELRQPDARRAALERVVREYPESSLATEAQRRLEP